MSIAASSLRMSPKRFSVTITSNWAGAATSCIAALSTSRWSSGTSGNSSSCTRVTVSRHSREVSSTFALSTLVTRGARRAERHAGDPLDLRRRCRRSRRARGRRRGPSRRSRCRPVSSRTTSRSVPSMRSRLSGLASSSAGLGRTGRRFANSPRPLRRPSSPCSGRGFAGSVVSHLGPPTAASSTASAARQASRTSSVSAVAVGVDRRAADQVLLELEVTDRGQQLARRGRDLRADPVAGKGCDAPRHGAERVCRLGRARRV